MGLNVMTTTPTLEVLSEKLRNYQSFIQQPIITKGKNTMGWSDWQMSPGDRVFIDTTILEHFITTPPRGYEHVVDKQKHFPEASLEVFWSPNKSSLFGSPGSLDKNH